MPSLTTESQMDCLLFLDLLIFRSQFINAISISKRLNLRQIILKFSMDRCPFRLKHGCPVLKCVTSFFQFQKLVFFILFALLNIVVFFIKHQNLVSDKCQKPQRHQLIIENTLPKFWNYKLVSL